MKRNLSEDDAFYPTTAEGSDPRWITHITNVAVDGFGADEVAALNALRRMKWDDESPDLRVLLFGLGDRQDFRAPIREGSTVWFSATSFVVTRYPKLRVTKRNRPEDYVSPRDFVRHVLQEELKRRSDLPSAASIEEEEVISVQRLRSMQFQRFRKNQGGDGSRWPTGGFRITFSAPVRGPFCIGHSCYFGLGLFLPSSPSSPRVARR